MNPSVALLITVILIILGLIFKNHKSIFHIQLIWIWILMAFSNGGVDYTVHLNFFKLGSEKIEFASVSWLYKLICRIFYMFNQNFFMMNCVVATILIIIMAVLIRKNTNNGAFVLSLFMIYPLADSIIQKRNFLGMIILSIGIIQLLKDEKNSKKIFVLLLLIAAQIHPSYYVYLLMFLLYNVKDNKFKATLSIIEVISFILIPAIPQLSSIILKGTSIQSKVYYYFVSLKIPLYQSICWWIVHAAFVFIFNYFQKITDEYGENDKKMSNNLIKLNYCSLIFMPLYYYEPTFFRFFRNILLINYIFAAKKVGKGTKLTKYKLMLIICIVIFVLSMFVSQFILFGKGYEYLVMPIFEKNLILGE